MARRSLSLQAAVAVSGLSAAGTTQGTATALVGGIAHITTVAAGAGVVLPASAPGITVTVINKGANALLVYPPASSSIDALAANIAYSVPVDTTQEFACATSTTWYTKTGNAATVTNGVYTTGDQNIGGKKVMTPTVATGASTEQAFRIYPNVLSGSPEWRNMFQIQSTYNAGVNGHGLYIKANASNQFELVTDWGTHLRLGVITVSGAAANATAAKYLVLTNAAITWDGNALLDAGNYTTYTVTKTGSGASGTWGISISGTAANATLAAATSFTNVADTRNTVTTPETINHGVTYDFKGNTTEGLSDGGTYFGEMTFRQYGSTTDWSGGLSHQLGFTDNGNIWQRSGSSTTWGSWKKLLDSSNFNSYAPTLTGTGASGSWGINITGTASNITGVYSGTLTSGQVTTALGFTPQGALTLTTTGTSGAATLIGNTLNIPQYSGGASGTVTSVALSLPADFSVTGSPVTSSGTLSATWASVSASGVSGKVFAGPVAGSATPTFRLLLSDDIPSLSISKITNLQTDLDNKAALASPTFTGTPVLTTTTTVGASGPVVGYRDIPITIQNAAYTFALADAGKGFGKDAATAYTYTIPANASVAFPVGTAITVFNGNATANITIAITTDTLRLAGTTTTGSRTLAPWGSCTLYKIASTVWLASGAGLT